MKHQLMPMKNEATEKLRATARRPLKEEEGGGGSMAEERSSRGQGEVTRGHREGKKAEN